ncbi:MAG: hypothetical protein IT406_00460 [Candidatus Yanofskybacteria bacterium]|nr:hypothetical protein [Candidatus Yanofskybacteria bacterium]
MADTKDVDDLAEDLATVEGAVNHISAGVHRVLTTFAAGVRQDADALCARLNHEPEVQLWIAEHGFRSLADVPRERVLSELIPAVYAQHGGRDQRH